LLIKTTENNISIFIIKHLLIFEKKKCTYFAPSKNPQTAMKTKFLLSVITSFLFCASVYAQSNPTPFDLSSGNYSFTQWDAASSPGTHPANSVFQITTVEDPGLADEPTGDWLCLYNLTARSRIIGQGTDGFSFINTTAIQDNQTRCGNGVNDIGGFAGVFVAAVNTTNRDNITVSWLNELLSQSTGTPTVRDWRMRLQYRVGTSAAWADVPGAGEFSSQTSTVGVDQNFGPVVLPNACNNQPVVQVRWKFYESATNDGGTRPEVRTDEITISSDFATGIQEVSASAFSVYPNPANKLVNFSNIISGSLFSSTGQLVKTFSSAKTLSLEGMEAGAYFIQTTEGRVSKLLIN
jgi:hypothetical protein